MLTTERTALIEILAKTDALFWPGRERFVMRQQQVRHERRIAYRETGLAITGGGSAADRQAFGRTLDALQEAGLVEITRGKRREGVRLSTVGDAVTRRLCGVATVLDARPLLGVAVETSDAWGAGGWPEHIGVGIEEFIGSQAENDSLQNMRQFLIPLLPVDYVSCSGDGDFPRRYWMTATEAGRAALAAGPPDDTPEGIEYDDEAADLYNSEWDRYAAELDSAEPERPQDLVLPGPCGVGWGSLAAILKWSKPQS